MLTANDLPGDAPMTTWNSTGNTEPVRTAVRFPIQVPVQIKTPTGDIQATTENISANGLLFQCDPLPKVDSTIQFTIVMPSAIMGTPENVSIHCIGRVVRHQGQGDDLKAAAIIDEYLLKA
jgi:hypothetical protein